jgi:GTPase SAR1 family protein
MKFKKLFPKRKYEINKAPNTQGKVNKTIFPLPFRCLIVGISGCGKTTLLYNLITQEWGVTFHSLYIFSKSLEQEVYKGLKIICNKLPNEGNEEIAHFYNNCEDIISVDECEPNNLIVYDDCVNLRQQYAIKYYYVRGRHKKYIVFIKHKITQNSIGS